MSLKYTSVLVICALALAGCGCNSGPNQANNSQGEQGTTGGVAIEPSNPVEPTTPPDEQKPNIEPDSEKIADAQDIPEEGTKGWEADTSLSPLQIAAQVDDALKGLKDTGAECDLILDVPAGKGFWKSRLKIQDSNEYKLEYTIIGKRSAGTRVSKASGTRKVVLIDSEWVEPSPGISSPAEYVQAWPERFPSLVYSGIESGANPFTQLIKGLSDKKSGYDLKMETRVMDYKGQSITNYRFLASKPGEPEGSFEIVVDARHKLPVTIRTDVTNDKGERWKLAWKARWKFHETFASEEFELPAQS